MASIKELQDIANVLRKDSLKATTAAGSGHATSCLSCAEIISSLFFEEMAYDVKNPNNPDNDEFILSKGHAAPILYSALFRAGCINENLEKLRNINSPLEGHPIPRSLNWIKVATGSLGQGLSAGLGMSMASKLQSRSFRTFVLLGDSEIAEGSVWEAAQLASYYKSNNLIAIVDCNKLGQRGETMIGYNLEVYRKRFESFGWNVMIIDGHNIKDILKSLRKSRFSDKPTVILAKTVKGKGVSFLEGKNGFHGKVLSNNELNKALGEIPYVKMPKIDIIPPPETTYSVKSIPAKFQKFKIGEKISVREAYGKTLSSLAKSNSLVIVLDAEVSNSTFADEVKRQEANQFIEMFIAEQNMISVALGLSKKGFNVFASTFAAFLTRAHDQIRMASLSSANFTICGAHAGISIGEDGASQMGLEDISLFRTIPYSKVFYPSDAVSTQALVELASKLPGIKYIRSTRSKLPVIYESNEKFQLGDFKVLKKSNKDKVILIGSGITLHEALKAHEQLKKKNIHSVVIDLYCIKPFNSKKFINFVKEHGNKIIIAEDHYKAGGIGEMISSEIANTDIKIKRLFVSGIVHSGKQEQLLEKYKINSNAIASAYYSL